jgi:hypothetical protein
MSDVPGSERALVRCLHAVVYAGHIHLPGAVLDLGAADAGRLIAAGVVEDAPPAPATSLGGFLPPQGDETPLPEGEAPPAPEKGKRR